MTSVINQRLFALLIAAVTLGGCASKNADSMNPGSEIGTSQTDGGSAGGSTTADQSTGVYGTTTTNGSLGTENVSAVATEFQQAVGDRVFFGTDRYDLDAQSQEILKRQAEWLKQHPNLRITIQGHCDERGTREYNLALGDRRATSIKNYLVALGVSANRIRTVSYGKEKPDVLGVGESVWAQNRRGVIIPGN